MTTVIKGKVSRENIADATKRIDSIRVPQTSHDASTTPDAAKTPNEPDENKKRVPADDVFLDDVRD